MVGHWDVWMVVWRQRLDMRIFVCCASRVAGLGSSFLSPMEGLSG